MGSVCVRYSGSQHLSYSQPSDTAERSGSGTSSILEWVGKPQTLSVFVVVTWGKQQVGLSNKKCPVPGGISAPKYFPGLMNSICNLRFCGDRDVNAGLVLQ